MCIRDSLKLDGSDIMRGRNMLRVKKNEEPNKVSLYLNYILFQTEATNMQIGLFNNMRMLTTFYKLTFPTLITHLKPVSYTHLDVYKRQTITCVSVVTVDHVLRPAFSSHYVPKKIIVRCV